MKRAEIEFNDSHEVIMQKVEQAGRLDVLRLRELRDSEKRLKNLEKEVIREKKQLQRAQMRRLSAKHLEEEE